MKNAERNNFSEKPLIDCHMHIEKPTTVDRAIEIFDLICDYYNYERMNLLALTFCDAGFIDHGSNVKALYVKSKINEKSPGKCSVFGHIHHHFDGKESADEYLRMAKQLYAMGVDGFKFIEGKPGSRKQSGHAIDDPIYDKMYAFIEEKGLPVLHHVGDPEKCWDVENASDIAKARGWVYDESFCTLSQLREETEGLLRKFPKMKVILAHFYFISNSLSEARAFMEKYPNANLDLTPGGEMFKGFSADHDGWVQFFLDYKDRIFYGTDTYNFDYGNNPDAYEDSGDAGHRINYVRLSLERSEPFEDIHYGRIIPLNLPEDVRGLIYHDNFEKLIPKVRPVNKQICAMSAASLCEAFRHGLVPIITKGTAQLEIENMEKCYDYFSE